MASLSKLLSFFGWGKKTESETPIEELIDDIETLLIKNRVGYLEVEREIDRVKAFEKVRTNRIKEGIKNEHLKRIVLREIMSLRKRLGTLDRVSAVYQQNIDIHLAVQDRLESQRSVGMKSISQEQLAELVLDHGEMNAEHREILASAKAMMESRSYLDEACDDPALTRLAEELEVEL